MSVGRGVGGRGVWVGSGMALVGGAMVAVGGMMGVAVCMGVGVNGCGVTVGTGESSAEVTAASRVSSSVGCGELSMIRSLMIPNSTTGISASAPILL